MNWDDLNIDGSWCVFLDRDGVINERLPGDYVKNLEEFRLLDNAAETIALLSGTFKHLFVVTNQQGIGKGIMSHEDLLVVHNNLLDRVAEAGGNIRAIYYAPELASDAPIDRKPAPGMALKAQLQFDGVDFPKCIMVGDSESDMEFGKVTGMTTIYLSEAESENADLRCGSLAEAGELLMQAFHRSTTSPDQEGHSD